ncbi:efflux transporter outer membrane subunit [Herminiimonas sp. CN]|uniref:efflux transporter outer membrane subunit n=1 Tax=Herminiimonas sp. CN TaxID=1349818 RepID=UPI00055468BD|nr:efflux transporter outer membrane subunit [Herminiimonas sp. CN]
MIKSRMLPSMRQLTLFLLAVGVLSGCSLAPQYVRPDAPVAASYGVPSGSAAAANATRLATGIGWREFFRDARLQALIASALDNNRDLRAAALRIEEARAQYNIQSADRLPTLNGVASGARSRTPADLRSQGSNNTGGRYDVGASLAAFELDFFGRVRSLNDAALAQYLATEEARQSVQISLVAEVAKAYLAERAFAQQQVLAQQSFDARSSSYTLAQKRFEVGASSALDIRQDESLLQSARVALVTLSRQRAQAENALVLLVGKPLADLPPAQPLAAQNIVTEIPAGLPSDLLANRPDIRQFEQQLKAANANIGAARAAFFPRITLTASAGTASSALAGLFDAGSGAWSFAPQLVLPIFDGGRNQGNLNLAEVRKDMAIVNYEKAIQSAFREVSDALVARSLLDEQIAAQAAVRDAEAERLKLSEARFRNGIASSLDVFDAQRQSFAAEQTLVQAQLLRLTNAIDLYRALGGGLQEGRQMQ